LTTDVLARFVVLMAPRLVRQSRGYFLFTAGTGEPDRGIGQTRRASRQPGSATGRGNKDSGKRKND